jgi:hypothetical protein
MRLHLDDSGESQQTPVPRLATLRCLARPGQALQVIWFCELRVQRFVGLLGCVSIWDSHDACPDSAGQVTSSKARR